MLIDVTLKPIPTIEGMDPDDVASLWRHERPARGILVYGCWNPQIVVADKILSEYPNFSRMELLSLEMYLERNPDDKYIQRQYATLQRCPENVGELYRPENWKHLEDPEDFLPGEKVEYIHYLSPYGVCDSPEQLLSMYDFEADPRHFFISMVRLRKEWTEPGGWRWHKWGPYIGKQKPQCEYLYEEPVIEEVFTYHIYELEQTITGGSVVPVITIS